MAVGSGQGHENQRKSRLLLTHFYLNFHWCQEFLMLIGRPRPESTEHGIVLVLFRLSASGRNNYHISSTLAVTFPLSSTGFLLICRNL
jgi:hypothetical protein